MAVPGGSAGKKTNKQTNKKHMPASARDIRDAGPICDEEDPLEKEMATCSSILAWEIPWRFGGVQPMWSQSWTGLSMHNVP